MKVLREDKKLNYASILLLSLVMLSSCGDLKYKTTQDYYDTFGDRADLIYTSDGLDKQTSHCSIKDSLYNARSVNEIRVDKPLDYEYYEYLAIKVDVDDFAFDTFALFVRAQSEEANPFTTLKVGITVVDELPDLVRGYAAPSVTIDEETGEEIEIPYDDKNYTWVSMTSELIKESAWMDFVIEEWTVDEKYAVSVSAPKDSYILLQIRNNTGYGADENLTPVKLSMINLMVAVYDPDGLNEIDAPDNDDDEDDNEYGEPDDYDG